MSRATVLFAFSIHPFKSIEIKFFFPLLTPQTLLRSRRGLTLVLPDAAPFLPVEAPIVAVPWYRSGPVLTDLNVTGAIALVARPIEAYFAEWGLSPATRALGIRGLVIDEGPNGSIGYFNAGIPPGSSFPFPIVAVDRATAKALRDLNGTVVSALLDNESLSTPWLDARTSGLFWFLSTGIIFVAAAVFILGIGRLIQFYHVFGEWKFNVINGVLILETIGGLLRVIYWVVDPLGSRGIWSDPARDVWHTISFPFGIAATLMLTLYWHETVSRSSLKFSWSIERLKIPSYILVAIVFLVELVIDILLLTRTPVNNLPIINSVTYVIIAFGLAVFFIITAARVLFQLVNLSSFKTASMSESKSSKPTKLSRKLEQLGPVAIKLMITAFCWLCIVATGIVATTDGFDALIPTYFCGVWFSIHYFMSFKALSTVLALRVPRSLSSTTNNSSKTSNSSSAMPV